MEGGLAIASSTHTQGIFVKAGKKVGKIIVLQRVIGKIFPDEAVTFKTLLAPKLTCIFVYAVHDVRMKEVTPTSIHWSLTFLRSFRLLSFQHNFQGEFWGMRMNLRNKVFLRLIKSDGGGVFWCLKIHTKLFSCSFRLLRVLPRSCTWEFFMLICHQIQCIYFFWEKAMLWYNFTFKTKIECASCLKGKSRCDVVLGCLNTASVCKVIAAKCFHVPVKRGHL